MTTYSGPPLASKARWLIWTSYAMTLLAAPLLFPGSLGLAMLAQMGYLIIICLSYNMLLGQGGMLSFGHAVYTGMGSFIAIHVMNMASVGSGVVVPLVLVPLVAGMAGMAFSALFGYITTKNSGTTLAMITMGIAELVAAMALMFSSFFGGEGGVTSNRVYGPKFLGFDFGPAVQVYYLIAAYCFICTAAMFAFTGTPLGQMLNAVRDNPERVEYVGYSTQRIRYLAFIIAGFFAGVGGGLAAINFEIVNAADSLGAMRSGSYLLFTFLGGATVFFGPIIGAVLLVFASVLLSELTVAWLLYLGLVFLFMVMFAPGGVASLIMMNARMASFGKFRQFCLPYLMLFIAAGLAIVGGTALVEMTYHMQLNASMGSVVPFLGVSLDTSSTLAWSMAMALLVMGVALFELARRPFVQRWGQAQAEIEADIRRRETA